MVQESIPGYINPKSLAYLNGSLKRAADIIGASVLLGITAPLIGYIALRIARERDGSVIYKCRVVGKGGKEFDMLKFRTMHNGADNGEPPWQIKRPDDERITAFGRDLRRKSWDELPQLINVLRGEMSLVGPRPARKRTLDHWMEQELEPDGLAHQYAHAVESCRGGCFGPHILAGRAAITDDPAQIWQAAVDYVNNASPENDILLVKTSWQPVINGDGAC